MTEKEFGPKAPPPPDALSVMLWLRGLAAFVFVSSGSETDVQPRVSAWPA